MAPPFVEPREVRSRSRPSSLSSMALFRSMSSYSLTPLLTRSSAGMCDTRAVTCLGSVGRAHRLYVVAGTEEKFIAWWSSAADASCPRPLLVYLHDASCRGEEAGALLAKGEGTPPRLLDEAELCLDALVVSPLLRAQAEWAKTMAEAARLLRIIDAVLRADELPSVDSGRIYCTGASCGGLGAYTLACRLAARADCPGASPPTQPLLPRFAAVAPVCGGGSPVFAKLLATTPTWFWHAQDDVVVAVTETDNIVQALRAVNVRLRKRPESPHVSSQAPVRYTRLSSVPNAETSTKTLLRAGRTRCRRRRPATSGWRVSPPLRRLAQRIHCGRAQRVDAGLRQGLTPLALDPRPVPSTGLTSSTKS